MRIRAKISLFVIPLVMLPLLLIGLFSYQSLIKGFEEQAYLDDQQLCLTAVTRSEQILDECHDSLILLASLLSTPLSQPGHQRLEKLIAGAGNPIREMAKGLAIAYSPHLRIRFIAPDGKELFVAQGLAKAFAPGNALDEPIFLQAVAVSALNRQPSQFPPVERDHHVLGPTTFSLPLYSNETLLGFVFLDLGLEPFSKILQELAKTRPGYYFLFDGGGRILAEGGNAPLSESDANDKAYQSALWQMRRNLKPNFTHEEFAAKRKRFFIASKPVKEYIAFKEPLPEERWYLAVVRAETPLLAAFRQSQMLFGMVLACGLVIAVAGTYYIAKKITVPIRQLTLATQKFAQGHLDTAIAATSRDEIGALATDFNRMAADLKQLISERRANETLITVGRFSAALAHDLRNPVEGLKLLSREFCKRVGPNHQEYEIADTIALAVERLSSLVNQSLDFARLNQPVFAVTDLANLANEVLQDFRFDEVELKKDFAHDLPLVKADVAQIKRVLANLVRNGLEACRSRRNSAPCQLSLTLRAVNEKVLIEVADTGPGISDEIREKIFEPFFSTKPGGHGLGLALARQIIANHGGTISFSSEIGHGTRFAIALPIVQGAVLEPR